MAFRLSPWTYATFPRPHGWQTAIVAIRQIQQPKKFRLLNMRPQPGEPSIKRAPFRRGLTGRIKAKKFRFDFRIAPAMVALTTRRSYHTPLLYVVVICLFGKGTRSEANFWILILPRCRGFLKQQKCRFKCARSSATNSTMWHTEKISLCQPPSKRNRCRYGNT